VWAIGNVRAQKEGKAATNATVVILIFYGKNKRAISGETALHA
jgi:hypothetical protein